MFTLQVFYLSNKSFSNLFIGLDKTLCGGHGIAVDATTLKVCPSTSKLCEVFFKQGKVNDIQVNTCSEYCSAHGLKCVKSYQLHEYDHCLDLHNMPPDMLQYTSCDQPDDVKYGIGCVCGK